MSATLVGTNVPLDDENWSGKDRQLLPISRRNAETIRRMASTMADQATTMMRNATDLFTIANALQQMEAKGMVADSIGDFESALARWQSDKDLLATVSA